MNRKALAAPRRASVPKKSSGPRTSQARSGKAPRTKPQRTLLGWVFRALLLLMLWGVVGLTLLVLYYAYDLPPTDTVVIPERRPAVTILAADGAPLARLGNGDETVVPLSDMPPHLIHAVLAIEDRRFHHHFGIDMIGIARAMATNVRQGRMVQGGSTITQQLAKNLFLGFDRTLRRKVQEALLALWLEATYTKEQILTSYLNTVYLGAGAYGVDAASRTYFNRPVSDIGVEQAAILAGLLKAPSRYSPNSNPDLAERRAATVLAAMVAAGYLTEADLESLSDTPPPPPRRPSTGANGRYYADWIAGQLDAYAGYTAGDITITTTLETVAQRSAEHAVERHLSGTDLQGAVVVQRYDGSVSAMVGGRSYAESQFNRAVQAQRQPGSAFKPIVYLAALANGLSPETVLDDSPRSFNGWSPQNYGGTYRGAITAAEALAYSSNIGAVGALQQAGIDNTIRLARQLGVETELRRDLSLALGTSEVSLLDLTTAYATLANGGSMVFANGVDRVANRDGVLVYRHQAQTGTDVARPWHVAELVEMMTGVVDYGTGRAAALDRSVAGKTGTSQAYRDAWFLGFTSDYVIGVWVGRDDGGSMDRVTGGGLPARIWQEVAQDLHGGLPARPLPALAALPTADSPPPVASGAPRDLLSPGTPASEEPTQPPPTTLEGLIDRILSQ